jgi:ribosomal protein S18 acetylase RimI-like enzyme
MDNGNAVTEIRLMTPLDVPFGMRLREIVGWNQTERDWHRFLTLEPQGCFVACRGEEKCGTVTTLRYEDRCGWIGMLLVDPAYRGQGIGTRLLRQGMSYLHHEKVETLKLDATPMGHPLYLQLGFEDEYSIERWEGISHAEASVHDRTMTIDQMDGVCQWDRQVFGADREPLLTSLWRAGPRYSAAAYSDNEISGYIMGRKGSRAHYLGPWVARPGSGAAEELFHEFLGRFRGEQVFVDICCENVEARALVESAGFRHQRTLTRMYNGPNRYPGLPHYVCGIAGPELG